MDWISRRMLAAKVYGRHVSALIIVFPAALYDWETLSKACSERKSERRGDGGEKKRERADAFEGNGEGDDGERAREFWVGELVGRKWADMGQVTGSP